MSQGKGLSDLMGKPNLGGILGDGDMKNLSTNVAENDHDVE